MAARQQARYLAGLYDLGELGPPLRKQAAQVGMEAARVWVALTDGGSGLEEFVRAHFGRPDLVVILDFWHAAEYRSELARALHPKDEEQRESLVQQWCQTMKHEGGAAILSVLQGLQVPAGQPSVREAYETAGRYIGWTTPITDRRGGR